MQFRIPYDFDPAPATMQSDDRMTDTPHRTGRQMARTLESGHAAFKRLLEKHDGDCLAALHRIAEVIMISPWPRYDDVSVTPRILRRLCVELDSSASMRDVDLVLTLAAAMINTQYGMAEWKRMSERFFRVADRRHLINGDPKTLLDQVKSITPEGRALLKTFMEGVVVDGVPFTRPEAMFVLELSPLLSITLAPRITVPRDWVLAKVIERVSGVNLPAEDVHGDDTKISLPVRSILKAIERYNNAVVEMADVYFGCALPVQ